jgi:dTMP kinase
MNKAASCEAAAFSSTPSSASPAANVFTEGLFSFEGGDGSGKSTQMRFLARVLRDAGREVVCVREPGGTAIGEALRSVVLNPSNTALSDRAELLIYEAARAQIVDEVIKPALARGAVVLCDRFYDSTVAYQGFGRGLDLDFIAKANAFAADNLVPRMTLFIEAPADQLATRLEERLEMDRLELAGEAFHKRVAEGFLQVCAQETNRVRALVSQEERVDTFVLILEALREVMPEAKSALDKGYDALAQLVEEEMELKHREREESAS